MGERINADVRRVGNTIEVDLLYPPRSDPPEPDSPNARYVEICLSDVRAVDSFRAYFDFDRNGYAIEQPKRAEALVASTGAIDSYEERVEWIETAFLPAWPFGHPEDIIGAFLRRSEGTTRGDAQERAGGAALSEEAQSETRWMMAHASDRRPDG